MDISGDKKRNELSKSGKSANEGNLNRVLETINKNLPLPNPSNTSIREMVDGRRKMCVGF